MITIVFVATATVSHAQFFPPVQQTVNVYRAGIYKEYGTSNSYLYTFNASREYKLRTWWSVGGELSMYRFSSMDYSTVGISLRPATRIFYSFRYFEVFGEARGGPIFMLPQNTHRLVNYNFVGSLGVDMYVLKNNAIRISVGYNHFSNGKPKADLINPTWDGVGVTLGFVKNIL